MGLYPYDGVELKITNVEILQNEEYPSGCIAIHWKTVGGHDGIYKLIKNNDGVFEGDSEFIDFGMDRAFLKKVLNEFVHDLILNIKIKS